MLQAITAFDQQLLGVSIVFGVLRRSIKRSLDLRKALFQCQQAQRQRFSNATDRMQLTTELLNHRGTGVSCGHGKSTESA